MLLTRVFVFYFLFVVLQNTWVSAAQVNDITQTISIKTLNNMGTEHLPFDEYSKEFLTYCQINSESARVLEIGAAYGHSSVEALSRGVKDIVVNDLDSRHLDIFSQKIPKECDAKIVCVPGSFPECFEEWPDNTFNATLAVRVFHFFPPDHLQVAAKEIHRLLRRGGLAYIVTASVYQKDNESCIQSYEERSKNGEVFAGYFDDLHERRPNLASHMPTFIHYLDPQTLTRVFTTAGLTVLRTSFFARPDYPKRVQLDGRECVGIILQKPL